MVKTFGQTASSFRRYQKAVKDYADFMTKYLFSMENAYSAYTTVVNAVFLFLIPLVASILTKLMHSSSNLMLADASFTAIEDIMSEKPLEESKKLPFPENGEIRFNNVLFQYEEGVKALDNVSFEIKPNTVTALVGESGGGKSTAANLIARFWDVTEGAVTIGGVDVRDIDYSELMKNISIVFQDTNLFKMYVAENVAMYKPMLHGKRY